MSTAKHVSRPQTVSVLASEGSMPALEIGIIAEVLGSSPPDADVAWYELTICAERPGSARIVGGASLHTPHGLDALAMAQTVIVPRGAEPRRIGVTQNSCVAATPASKSIRARCTLMRAMYSRARAAQPDLTCACISSARTLARQSPIRSRAGWSPRHIATADRPNTSNSQ